MKVFRLNERALGLLLIVAMHPAQAAAIRQTEVPASVLAEAQLESSAPLLAKRFHDVDGDHILVLTKESKSSPHNPNSGRIEFHRLNASLFRHAGNGWTRTWAIVDRVDCPGLDSQADFYIDNVTITDANDDGIAEVYVPYRLFCGGGVDPSTIKIIMRTKHEKYALRGEAKIVAEEQTSFGGEKHLDGALLKQQNLPYKKQILKIWEAVYVEKLDGSSER